MITGMPELGAPPTGPSSPSSHVSTSEWQSFEVRMRRRRAERCVLRAEAALEAGFEEDARAAIDEAHRLDPQTPDLEALRHQLALRRAAETSLRQAAQRRRIAAYAAALLIAVVAAFGSYTLLGGDAPQETVETTPAARTEPAPPAPTAAAPPPPAEAATPQTEPLRENGTNAPVPERPVAPEREGDERENPRSPVRETPDPIVTARAATIPPARLSPSTATSMPLPAVRPLIDRAPALPAGTSGANAPLNAPAVNAAAGVTELPGVRATPPPVVPAAPPAPERSPVVDEINVRATLARYEAAYSSLNASAAQAVWPGVDRRSLSKAFDSLSSQQVSLGNCAVSVSGARASARCQGQTTWTPKVGGGTRNEARQWQFELANYGGAWQIVQAEAR